jgi:hypothetical protein
VAYADDIAGISRSLSDATEVCYKLSIAAKRMGLEISRDETELLNQNRRAEKQLNSINLIQETIEAVKDFVYRG